MDHSVRPSIRWLNAGWLRIFSLLVPVGPPLGLGSHDERALESLAQRLA